MSEKIICVSLCASDWRVTRVLMASSAQVKREKVVDSMLDGLDVLITSSVSSRLSHHLFLFTLSILVAASASGDNRAANRANDKKKRRTRVMTVARPNGHRSACSTSLDVFRISFSRCLALPLLPCLLFLYCGCDSVNVHTV